MREACEPSAAHRSPHRILIVEDDPDHAGALRQGLDGEGYATAIAGTVHQARAQLRTAKPDLILLDLTLPDGDGLDLLAHDLDEPEGPPVIILSARGTLPERLEGFRTGADDYMVKPFALVEIYARIAAVLRRAHPVPTLFRIDDLVVDTVARRAERGGVPLMLSARELDLLAYLARFENRAVPRDLLARDIWQVRSRVTSMDNVIDVSMGRLRRKLDLPGQAPLLHTVRGLGFRLGRLS